MKISIGTKTKEGPWGGGNLFAINLKKYLERKGHKVVSDLCSDDIDLILLTEPRKTSESSAFSHYDIINYKKYVKQDTLVVHRLNECDERKNTQFVNKYLKYANQSVANYSVFVSYWLKDIYHNIGLQSENSKVIYAGADSKIFNNHNTLYWDRKSKFKIVTHHWGANWNKGFDIYSHFDNLLAEKEYKDRFEFTYIGNLPKNFSFKNSNHIKPLSGNALVNELKKNHAYLTASINEPSGNHHIEGAQCGLPVMFLNSGGTVEYCKDFGLIFEKNNFENQLNMFHDNYSIYRKKIQNYPHNAEKMCEEFEALFLHMFENKSKFLNNEDFLSKKKYFEKKYFLTKRKLN